MRVLLSAILAMLLSACFMSEEPLLRPAGTDCPVLGEFDAAMVIPNASDDGERTKLTITPSPGGGCVLPTRIGSFDLVFARVAGGTWIVQATPDSAARNVLQINDRQPFYLLARREQRAWVAGVPSCDFSLNDELMNALNVTRTVVSERDACLANSVASLQTLAALEGRDFPVWLVFEEPAGRRRNSLH